MEIGGLRFGLTEKMPFSSIIRTTTKGRSSRHADAQPGTSRKDSCLLPSGPVRDRGRAALGSYTARVVAGLEWQGGNLGGYGAAHFGCLRHRAGFLASPSGPARSLDRFPQKAHKSEATGCERGGVATCGGTPVGSWFPRSENPEMGHPDLSQWTL